MSRVYVALAVMMALIVTFSALMKLRHDPKVTKSIHDVVGVPLRFFPFLAACELAGAVGLLLGVAWPALGLAASAGLALYFIGAVAGHVRVGDFKGLGPAAFLLGLSCACVIAASARVAAEAPRASEASGLVRQLGQFPAEIDPKPTRTEQRRETIYVRLRTLDATAVPALQRGLADTDVQVRRNVALYLNFEGGNYAKHASAPLDLRPFLSPLVLALRDGDERVKAMAAQALGHLGSEAAVAVPDLLRLLTDPSEGLRNSACLGLRGIGPAARDALPALRVALADPSENVRRFAQRAIERIGVGMLAPASEDAGVRAALNHYLQGHATGDPSHMRLAFLPTAHIEGIRDGAFTSWTLEQYCARFTGKPAADEASRRRTIDTVDINGNAAMARATLVHGSTTFTDYFVLLKVGDEWRIANKVYVARPTQ